MENCGKPGRYPQESVGQKILENPEKNENMHSMHTPYYLLLKNILSFSKKEETEEFP